MSDFMPNTDGIDHINVYSKSRSVLGRLLSNFAHTPITLNDKKFECIEAWWYWTKMTKLNQAALFPVFTDEQLDEMRSLLGKNAKDFFRKNYFEDSDNVRPTKEELMKAYKQKLIEHPEIKETLLNNNLPIAHYYIIFGKKIEAESTLWAAKLWEELKNE